MPNPFNPAPGALPERILGREPELAAIREAIRRAKDHSAPVPLVFLGQRGMGKTVLLRKLREEGGMATLAVGIEVLPGRPFDEAFRTKIEAAIAGVESLPRKVAGTLEKALANLPKLSYELPHDQGAIAIAASQEPERSQTLAAMLEALRIAARDAKRFLTITLDEIQDADVSSMQTLVRFIHESAQSEFPVLFACAGLDESHAVLEKMRTYVQRWTSFDLRLLTEAETVEAIREPILAEKSSIENPAVELLEKECAGYPFFIAAYGSGAWEKHRGRTITLSDVETSLPEIRARIETNFYVRPLARMSPRESAFAIDLAALGPGVHEIGAVAASLGAKTPDISSIRTTLVRKGIISVPIPGKVAFRMPFTDRYLRDHRREFETAEVLAFREDLARRVRRATP